MLRAKGITKFKNAEFEIEFESRYSLQAEFAVPTQQLTNGAGMPSMWSSPEELEKIEFLASDMEAGYEYGAD